MKTTLNTAHAALLAAALLIAGCATASAPPPGTALPSADGTQDEDSPAGPGHSPPPFADDDDAGSVFLGAPIIVDREDLRLGTTAQYRRIPTANEMHDLTLLPSLTRLAITLDRWPSDYARIAPLDQLPEGVDLVVLLAGWPPSRAFVDSWNYLRIPLRVIVVVPGPPPSIDAVTALNQMRGLERVIAQMDDPSRSGFERLQRPLNFRKLIR